MQQIITKRSKCPDEIIPVSESESSLRDEINSRTCKAGYTDSDGQQKISRSNGTDKGDVPCSCNKKKYDEGYVKAFGHN